MKGKVSCRRPLSQFHGIKTRKTNYRATAQSPSMDVYGLVHLVWASHDASQWVHGVVDHKSM